PVIRRIIGGRAGLSLLAAKPIGMLLVEIMPARNAAVDRRVRETHQKDAGYHNHADEQSGGENAAGFPGEIVAHHSAGRRFEPILSPPPSLTGGQTANRRRQNNNLPKTKQEGGIFDKILAILKV